MLSDIRHALAQSLEPSGFEVLGGVEVSIYNESLEPQFHGFRLPHLNHEQALVLVVGNTRRLWPRFLRAYHTAPLSAQEHPLDQYSRVHIAAAAEQTALRFGVAHTLRYAFDAAPNAVAIQRLAMLAGVAEVAPIGLCIHATYGPWFSLRAAVVFDTPGPPASRATPTCSACSERPCLAARARVLENVSDADFSRADFELHWQDWLAMRDACPIGRDARFGEQQIRYHYTKDVCALSDETDNARDD